MAISTDALIEFFGTQDDLDSTSAAVANNAFSVAGDLATWTNDDDATHAEVIFEGTFGTAPTAGRLILFYLQALDILDSTKDQRAPTTGNHEGLVGSWAVQNTTASQVLKTRIRLPNAETSQLYQPWIRNSGTGQSLSSGWSVQITPLTVGPHP